MLCPCVTLCRRPLCRGFPSSVVLAFSLLIALLQTSLCLRRILQEGRASSLLSCQYIICMLEVSAQKLGAQDCGILGGQKNFQKQETEAHQGRLQILREESGRKAPNALGLLSVGLGRAFLRP